MSKSWILAILTVCRESQLLVQFVPKWGRFALVPGEKCSRYPLHFRVPPPTGFWRPRKSATRCIVQIGLDPLKVPKLALLGSKTAQFQLGKGPVLAKSGQNWHFLALFDQILIKISQFWSKSSPLGVQIGPSWEGWKFRTQSGLSANHCITAAHEQKP